MQRNAPMKLALLFALGASLLGLAACGSEEDSPEVKKNADAFIYSGIEFGTYSQNAVDTNATVCSPEYPDCRRAELSTHRAVAGDSPYSEWSQTDPVYGSWVFADNQQVNFRLQVVKQGIVVRGETVELYIAPREGGCGTLPGSDTKPPGGDAGTYDLTERTFTICGHQIEFVDVKFVEDRAIWQASANVIS